MKEAYWYQDAAIEAFWRYFEEGNTGNPIIALPTGTGKSFVIALLIQRIMRMYPDQRILVLTHVKKLISQNHDELVSLWPNCPVGIHSAGLVRRDSLLPIIFGGVQSIATRVDLLGHRDIVIIDECHLLGPDDETRYQKVIKALRGINPYLKVLGLSATPYRTKHGLLTGDPDGIFTDIIYDMTSCQNFNRLLAEGFLVPPIPRPTHTQLDFDGVRIDNLAAQERAVDKHDINARCCEEIVWYGRDRQSWLVFATGVDHADHINQILRGMGIDSDAVHSKKGSEHNDKTIERWENGTLQCIVNRDMLTTGVNNRRCDLIAELRATASPGLRVQMLGRGTRTYPGKINCLVLDFAGNTRRCGPINDPYIPNRPKKGTEPGEAPIRICGNCGCYNHASARACDFCGYEFPRESKLVDQPDQAPLVKTDVPQIETFPVHHMVYRRHKRGEKLPTLRVTYHCGAKGIQIFDKHVCFEHPGFAGKKARDWWRLRMFEEIPPATVEDAIERIDNGRLPIPQFVKVHVNLNYPEIIQEVF